MSEWAIIIILFLLLSFGFMFLMFSRSKRGVGIIEIAHAKFHVEFERAAHSTFSENARPFSPHPSSRFWVGLKGSKHHFRLDTVHPMYILEKSIGQYVIRSTQGGGKIMAELRWYDLSWHIHASSHAGAVKVDGQTIQNKKLGNGNQIIVGKLCLVFKDFGIGKPRHRV